MVLLISGFGSCAKQVIETAPASSMASNGQAISILSEALTSAGLEVEVVRSDELRVAGKGLVLAVDASLPPNVAYQVSSRGGNSIVVKARNESLLADAAYGLLRELGFKYLHPAPGWSIVPKLSSQDLNAINLTGSNAFPYAKIFSSRSINGLPAYGEWLQQNGVYSITNVQLGHYGVTFNKRYRDQIESNPEWRPIVNGQRIKYNKKMKLDYTHPGVIQLMKSDAEKNLRKLIAADVPPPYFISVEPTDRGGFTERPYRKGSSVSDQVFFAANEVAKHLSSVHPEANASLLAYTHHSDLPSFPLEPNVAVTVVTGWFQYTGSTENLLQQWGRSSLDYLGLRTYSGVPKAKEVRVQFPAPATPVDLLQTGAKYGYQLYREQSVYSGGAMGYRHYLTAKLLAEPNADLNAVKEEYFRLAFGPAAAKMRELYDVVWYGFNGKQDLQLSVQLINEADALTRNDPAIQKRIADVMAYVIYLDRALGISGSADVAGIESLLAYASSIDDRMMVNTEHLARHFRNMLRKTHAISIPKGPGLSPQLDDRAVRNLFATLDPGTAPAAAPKMATVGKAKFPDERLGEPMLSLRGGSEFGLQDIDSDGFINTQITTTGLGKSDLFIALDFFTDSGELVRSEKISTNNKQAKTLRIPVPRGGTLRLKCHARGGRYALKITEEVRFWEGQSLRLSKPFSGLVYLDLDAKRKVIKPSPNAANLTAVGRTTGREASITGGRSLDLNQVFEGESIIAISGLNSSFVSPDRLRLFFDYAP
ncbi:hypothetical protein A3850_007305 [Lewinella sp. 4G2]|nr:hypothetical protein A3850_007305 [Lewinella sp. 4G2]